MHFAVSLLNRGRGSGSVARQHVRALLEAGHRVTLLYPGMERGVDGADNRNVLISSAVLPVHEYLPNHDGAQRRVSRMTTPEAMARIADYERALARVADVDLIVAHHGNLNLVAAQRVARRLGIPYVTFVHGTGIEPRHHGGYEDEVWAQIAHAVAGADGVIVTTEYVRDRLVKPLLDIPDERFLVLPCGVDLEEFAPGREGDVPARYGLPDRYVICPGALTPLKGPQNVVAASEVYGATVPTIFIGDGELRAHLEPALGARGRFLGYVSDADKAALISGATLLVAAPEKLEHFGIIYIEALAAGTPVVAYRGGGVDSIVTSDVGILTRRNPFALGVGVRSLLRDEARTGAMAAWGRLRAIERYEMRLLGTRLVEWLTRVATGRSVEASVASLAVYER